MNPIVLAILSGLSIGVLGSFHCIGMCGPLALALPVQQLAGTKKTTAILLYNFGRALSYASLGIVFGAIGSSFQIFHLQQWLSIVAGVFILAIFLLGKFSHYTFPALAKLTQNIKFRLSHYLSSPKTTKTYLSIGVLNGYLPCGLVYLAIAASLATGSLLHGSLLMLAFGFGTMPIMALTMAFGKFISIGVRNRLNKISPYIIMGVACLLIIRGLNLGIPYVSPSLEKGEVNCCERK